jgi:hypothetical protein
VLGYRKVDSNIYVDIIEQCSFVDSRFVVVNGVQKVQRPRDRRRIADDKVDSALLPFLGIISILYRTNLVILFY